MNMRSVRMLVTAASAVSALAAASSAWAVALPVVNPGFDGTVTGSGFSYESASYAPGDGLPDHTFTFDTGPASGGFGDTSLGDSATGAGIPNSTVNIPGWVGTGATGIVYDSRDYVVGQGPDGPGGLLNGPADNQPRGVFQTLTGTSYQPNTIYTLTAEVSDRRFGGGDNVTFPVNFQLTLVDSVGDLPGVQAFVAPAPGSTTLATFSYTTGAVAPGGDVTIAFRASGYAGLAASQALVDNVIVDATPIPEPSGVALALGALAVAFTGRCRLKT